MSIHCNFLFLYYLPLLLLHIDPGPVREITAPIAKPRKDSIREPATEAEEQPFQIYFTMAETDVILVETMEKIDANALLLNVSLGFPNAVNL